ncbi:hypothetical protein VBR48_25350 [Klebsiella pneumoniae]|uniref:hypothetical protein n=1 Tax=Klebsiella pneumoniae TaxID=573 RepID=UPI000E02428B|nr:hypothetical protein [Klebsiella pneumoniae]STS63051.1 Uncharacterised protein [Klebsiella aerogenes]HCD1346030.1 hypothetical protein [Klebsiella pneumoniae subsp. pneumoniae]MEA4354187.1 hypothetical protein [Klebsiella pneumoniae]MEA4430806.1 hypothetical protein [Klebsiella pneumoniae]MEA4748367.1 hypothetical protein [Klebsiella pneumoniae]
MKKGTRYEIQKKHWSAVIKRFRKISSVEFFVRKTLLMLDDPEEKLFLSALAQKKIEEPERESVPGVDNGRS